MDDVLFHSRCNPSRWSERLESVGLALGGLLIAIYLAGYQLGIVFRVWDPFFGNGSAKVLHSSLSRALPIPDAALGALGYVAEIITGLIGDENRWRTLPWVAVGFGCIAVAMGLAGIGLTICQPAITHAWCTLCLSSALISIIVAMRALPELRAAARFLKNRHRNGQDELWKPAEN